MIHTRCATPHCVSVCGWVVSAWQSVAIMPRKRKVYDGADPEAAEAAGKRHRAELERQRRLDFTEEAKRHRAEAERLRRLGFTEEDKRREAERKRLKRLEKRTLGQRVTRTEEQKAKHAERMRLSRLNKKLSGQRVQRTEEQKAKEARRKWAARHRADPGPSTSAAVMPLLAPSRFFFSSTFPCSNHNHRNRALLWSLLQAAPFPMEWFCVGTL